MSRWRYDAADLDWIEVEVMDGEDPPAWVARDRKRYARNYELADLAAIRAEVGNLGVIVRGATSRKGHDLVFESHQLPRWDKDAPRHGPTGKPRFDGTHEIEEYLAKKRHKEGLDMRYGEL